jgi:hypothetical protein
MNVETIGRELNYVNVVQGKGEWLAFVKSF